MATLLDLRKTIIAYKHNQEATIMKWEYHEDAYQAKNKAEGIARAKQIRQQLGSRGDIMVQRDYAPLWFAHLVRNTIFEFLAYVKVKENA